MNKEQLPYYKHYFKMSKAINYYDNKFKIFDLNFDLSKHKFSYSQVEDFYGCPFKFFCKRILKLDSHFDDSFYPLKSGNLVHSIMQQITKTDFNNACENAKQINKYDKWTELEKLLSQRLILLSQKI